MSDPVIEDDPLFQLSNLHLKKIVKENHAHAVKELKFCEIHPNLLASVGGTQASIYDNDNAGEHLDIMMNFVNMDTPALLKVLAASESARKIPTSVAPSHGAAGYMPSYPHFSGNGASHSATNSAPTYSGIKISDDSRAQLLAMRPVVEDGGFDEDIFVGGQDLGVFPSKQPPIKPSDDAMPTLTSATEPTHVSSDILQNKRLMQGAGRDVELFDRDDRKLRTCAWVAFPPRKFFTPTELASLHEALRLRTRTPFLPDQEPSINGSCDVDVTRVDRTDSWLAVAGADGLVQLLSIAYAKALYVLPGHCEPIIALASGQMSTCLASLSQSWIIVWNLPLIARHHYNSYHSGGPGLEYIYDEDDVFGTAGARYGDGTFSDDTHNVAWPEHLKRLPREYQRWILQVIPTPSPLLSSLEFTQFGLVAGAASGHLYNWPFVPRDQSFVQPAFASTAVSSETLLSDLSATNGPRTQPAKRPTPGSFPRPECPPFWSQLPKILVRTTPRAMNWNSNGEAITGLVKKRGTPESPIAAIALRTNSRIVVLAPKVDREASHSHPNGVSQLFEVDTLCEILLPSSPSGNAASSSITSTRSFNWEGTFDPKAKPPSRQALDVSLCGRFAMAGQDSGDAYLLDLLSSRVISKLEHKRSKAKITACVINHKVRNVVFTSDAIIWRWDYISPSFLQKERAEQAQAEAEGVDIASDTDVEDAVGALEC